MCSPREQSADGDLAGLGVGLIVSHEIGEVVNIKSRAGPNATVVRDHRCGACGLRTRDVDRVAESRYPGRGARRPPRRSRTSSGTKRRPRDPISSAVCSKRAASPTRLGRPGPRSGRRSRSTHRSALPRQRRQPRRLMCQRVATLQEVDQDVCVERDFRCDLAKSRWTMLLVHPDSPPTHHGALGRMSRDPVHTSRDRARAGAPRPEPVGAEARARHPRL